MRTDWYSAQFCKDNNAMHLCVGYVVIIIVYSAC